MCWIRFKTKPVNILNAFLPIAKLDRSSVTKIGSQLPYFYRFILLVTLVTNPGDG